MSIATIHIVPKNRGWAVKGEGLPNPSSQVYSTQTEAITAARTLIRKNPMGQIAVHGRRGSIRSFGVHGLPQVQTPPHKSSLGTKSIERAVSSVILDRLSEQ